MGAELPVSGPQAKGGLPQVGIPDQAYNFRLSHFIAGNLIRITKQAAQHAPALGIFCRAGGPRFSENPGIPSGYQLSSLAPFLLISLLVFHLREDRT
jgi:hypothetical protein